MFRCPSMKGCMGCLEGMEPEKSSLMRILATLQTQSSGVVTMNGVSIHDTKTIRGMVGYLPQDFSYIRIWMFTRHWIIWQFCLRFPDKKEEIESVIYLEAVNLQDHYKAKIKTLSGGMRRRLGIAQALTSRPTDFDCG